MTGILIVLTKVVLALVWLFSLTLVMTWVERKESAVIQDRIGANRASIFGVRAFGLFQPFADAIKMMFKEDFQPSFTRRFWHGLAPFISFFCVSVTIAAVPFGPPITIAGRVIPLQAADLEAGLPFVLAMLSLGVYGILLAGWASNNRFALLGGIRGAAQLISYEVGLGLALIGLVLVFPSLRMSRIVEFQGGLLWGAVPRWGILLQPVGFIIFFIAAVAETKRVPFDLPEGESEIIGFYTEYSGLKWGMFMMTDFLEVIIVACLAATFYFGGWQVPWLEAGGFHFPWGWDWALPRAVVIILQVLSFNLKVALLCGVQVLFRWTYPRPRYDQLMDLGWKILVPLGFLNILVTAWLVGGST